MPAEKDCIAPAIIMYLGLIATLVWLELRPTDEGRVAAFFAPGTSSAQLIRAVKEAQASLIDRRGSLLIAQSDQHGLPDRLRKAGALFVFNPLGAEGCGYPAANKDNIFGRTDRAAQ